MTMFNANPGAKLVPSNHPNKVDEPLVGGVKR
jgi:hypothetical protein